MLFRTLPDPLHVSFEESEDDEVLRMLSALMQVEALREGDGTGAILSSLSSILLTMILRTARGTTTDAALWTASANTAIVRVVERVLDNPGGDWSIARSAGSLRCRGRRSSVSSSAAPGPLSALSSRESGSWSPPTCFQTTSFTVAGVAAEVGFKSESAFSRAFRQHTGSTPARFRCAAGA